MPWFSAPKVVPHSALRRALQPLIGEAPFTYVDCGARGGKLPRHFRHLKNTAYVGFEADAEECARLNATARPGHRYVAAFLAAARESRTFRVTASAACCSLLEPNEALLSSFGDLRDAFRVEREFSVETVSLDDVVRDHGIPRVDFLELDTQGSELEILIGGQGTLRKALGVRVEVEFAPMYTGQALFADVDRHLRDIGFQLFDLSRYHVRRATVDPLTPTHGQLLWGHAVYLRRQDTVSPPAAGRLAVIAALLDFPDYAAEVLGALMASAQTAPDLQRIAQRAHEALKTAPRARGLTKWFDAWRARAAAAETGETVAARQLDSSRGRVLWRD